MNRLELAADFTGHLTDCVEALWEPVAELLATVPPIVLAGVLVELLIETANHHPPDAPAILSAALDSLRTAGTN